MKEVIKSLIKNGVICNSILLSLQTIAEGGNLKLVTSKKHQVSNLKIEELYLSEEIFWLYSIYIMILNKKFEFTHKNNYIIIQAKLDF